MPELLTLTRAQGANRALVDGDVSLAGYTLTFADEPVLIKGFRRMVRNLEYDVAELAVTTYLTAKEHGAPFTALPIFLVRGFHHGATQVMRGGPVRTPRDLAGGRVGVNRGYTVTTGVWGRAILAAEHGLDLDSVTWVRSGDEHVPSYVPPRNVVPAPADSSLTDLLLSGDLDAVVGAGIDHPDVVTLVPDAEEAGFAALRERGLFPINHLVVVRDDVLARHPDVAVKLFEAFTEAKRRYIYDLRVGKLETTQDRLLSQVMEVTGADPLPYGMAPNWAVLEELAAHAVDQHILTRPVMLEDLFVADTLDLVC